MNDTRPMNSVRCLLTSALLSIAYSAVAADWHSVITGHDEVVFVDHESVHDDAGAVKATVLRNYSATQYLGDWYPHKSKMIVYRFDCDGSRLGIEQWAFHSDNFGGGRTLWADHVKRDAHMRNANDAEDRALLGRVCAISAAMHATG
jgi:hypothetical protein